MIMHLPGGYDSVLAKDGQNLSQGQPSYYQLQEHLLPVLKYLYLMKQLSVDTRQKKKLQDAMN